MSILKTENCPICGQRTNAFQKTMAKYNKLHVCRNCFGRIIKSGINAIDIKKKTLEELRQAVGVEKTKAVCDDTISKVSSDANEFCGLQNPRIEPFIAKHKKSRKTFPLINPRYDNLYLKYKYYDVMVQGVQYTDLDFSAVDIGQPVKFVFDPHNEFDPNAIQVWSNSTFIGYVPKNNLQAMIRDFIHVEDKVVEGFIREINENSKLITMALGFYKTINEKFHHMDVRLTKTSKKDEFGVSRQENLDTTSEGDIVDITYNCDSQTYVVTNMFGEELGEISLSKSEKLQELEDEGKQFAGRILEMGYTDSGKNTCKMRVLILD